MSGRGAWEDEGGVLNAWISRVEVNRYGTVWKDCVCISASEATTFRVP